MSQEITRGKSPIFRTRTFDGEMQMFCPECGEEIEAVDVESYLHCPVCNCILKQDDEFDDFLLEGVAKAWIAKHSRSSKG